MHFCLYILLLVVTWVIFSFLLQTLLYLFFGRILLFLLHKYIEGNYWITKLHVYKSDKKYHR